MEAVLSWVIATLITFPILGYVIVFVSTKQITKNHHKAVNFSINFVTIPFVLSVYFLIQSIWDISSFWIILLAIIILAIMVVIVHHKVKGEIDLQKVLRGIWRINTVFFILVYCILVGFGILSSMIQVL